MSDPITRLNAALSGRRVLFVASLLLLPLGCGGDDDPMGPSSATLAVTTTVLLKAAQTLGYSQTLGATGGDGSSGRTRGLSRSGRYRRV